jgi:hypothetical protein
VAYRVCSIAQMEGMAGKEGSTSKMKLVTGGKERTG